MPLKSASQPILAHVLLLLQCNDAVQKIRLFYYSGDKIEDEMGGACSMGVMENDYKILVRQPEKNTEKKTAEMEG
jgi:hypothetical protein